MRKETATAIATTKARPKNTTRDGVLGAVVLPDKSVERIALAIINRILIMNPMARALLLMFTWCVSAPAFTKNGNGTISTDGSASDVQAAINAASAGNTILIPAGTFDWTSKVIVSTNVSIQGAGSSSTILLDSTDNGTYSGNNLVSITTPTPFACTLSGIGFNGNNATTGSGILVEFDSPALMHDCSFVSKGGLLDQVRFAVNGGVVWNCTFYDNDANEEAITFQNSNGSPNGVSPDWTTGDTMGTADTSGTANTYIEDCTFTDMVLQAMDFSDNSRVVVRHCTFKDSSIVSHGLDTGLYGTRQWEVYDNNFVFDVTGTSPAGNPYPLGMNWWFYIRGGTGVIWGNTMPDIVAQILGSKSSILMTVFNIRRTSAYIPCQTTWQAIHQVGQGYNNGLVLDPVYIWGNTGGIIWQNPGINDWQPDQCGNGLTSATFIQANRDYYVGIARPGYTAFTYPHPLRGGVTQPTPTPNSTPAPPQNLRVIN